MTPVPLKDCGWGAEHKPHGHPGGPWRCPGNPPREGDSAHVDDVTTGLAMMTHKEFEREGYSGDTTTVLAAIGEAFRVASMLHRHAPDAADEMADWYEDEDKRSATDLDLIASIWVDIAHMLARGEMTYDQLTILDPPSGKERGRAR